MRNTRTPSPSWRIPQGRFNTPRASVICEKVLIPFSFTALVVVDIFRASIRSPK